MKVRMWLGLGSIALLAAAAGPLPWALAQEPAPPQEAVAPQQAVPPQEGTAPAAGETASNDANAPGRRGPQTDAEREEFLLKATVIKRKGAPGGITSSTRATLRLGDYEHDAHIQSIDEYKTQITLSSGLEIDFRDSWKNNVAAYKLDRLLGIRWVPVTVARRDNMKMASFTWWVDDVQMTEKDRYTKKIKSPDADAWNHQIYVVRIFDQLIYNVDRNLGNLLIDKDWRIWMIDHTRAFKIFKDLKKEQELGNNCMRELLPALKTLDKPTLKAKMDGLLAEGQIDALLSRRDHIVSYFEGKVSAMGEGRVFYDLPARQ
jgi:hypothetical protein